MQTEKVHYIKWRNKSDGGNIHAFYIKTSLNKNSRPLFLEKICILFLVFSILKSNRKGNQVDLGITSPD